jgi:hypothetical protein
MPVPQPHDSPAHLPDEEIKRRSEAALLRALSTPHKRQSEMKIGQNSKRKTERESQDPRRGSNEKGNDRD